MYIGTVTDTVRRLALQLAEYRHHLIIVIKLLPFNPGPSLPLQTTVVSLRTVPCLKEVYKKILH